MEHKGIMICKLDDRKWFDVIVEVSRVDQQRERVFAKVVGYGKDANMDAIHDIGSDFDYDKGSPVGVAMEPYAGVIQGLEPNPNYKPDAAFEELF